MTGPSLLDAYIGASRTASRIHASLLNLSPWTCVPRPALLHSPRTPLPTSHTGVGSLTAPPTQRRARPPQRRHARTPDTQYFTHRVTHMQYLMKGALTPESLSFVTYAVKSQLESSHLSSLWIHCPILQVPVAWTRCEPVHVFFGSPVTTHSISLSSPLCPFMNRAPALSALYSLK